MTILLIAYSFPPFHDAQSLRWYYLANTLAEAGLEIDVLTVRYPIESDPMWKFHENVKVLRVYPGPLEFVHLYGKDKLKVDELGNRELRQSMRFKFVKSLYWSIRKLVGSVLPGDLRTEWFPYAVWAIKDKVKADAYSCMITSHEPWVDSLLGLYLKKKNPGLKWVADFGDPYVAPYTPKHKLWLENHLERSIYQSADVLLFTNEGVIDHLTKKYTFLRDKDIHEIGQGFSYASCIEASRSPENGKNKVFTLTYTGSFYRGLRDPSNLIKALSGTDFPYRFLLAGKNEAFTKDFGVLGERFEFLGFIDHFASLNLQRESDVLVHLGNNNSVQVPGKIFEYLGALRPILSINSNPSDSTGELVTELNRGVCSSNDPRSIKEALFSLYTIWQKGDSPFALDYDGIYEYSWEKRANVIHGILQEGLTDGIRKCKVSDPADDRCAAVCDGDIKRAEKASQGDKVHLAQERIAP